MRETDATYESLVEAKYEIVRNLPREQRVEQMEKLKTLVEDRNTNGTYRIALFKEEGCIGEEVEKIFKNMAKWNRYVLMDIPESKKCEEYASMVKIMMLLKKTESKIKSKKNKEQNLKEQKA